MRALYSLLLFVVRPFVRLRLLWRARSAPAYGERIEERFGQVPAGLPEGALWIHTVSAGETIAAAPLIASLTEALAEHNIPVLVTTMTPTGSAEVARLFGDSVAHCYAPYDFSDAVRRFLDATRPCALVLMETEIWPNMISMTAKRNIPIALINARLSEGSARGYSRVQTLFTPVLRGLSWIACQFPADAERFRELGASAAQVEVVGNMKFDLEQLSIPEGQQAQLQLIRTRAELDSRSVWIAGSTHEGEDSILLGAHQRLLAQRPNSLLIIVPRHPERFTAVYELACESFTAARLSDWLVNPETLSAAEVVSAQAPRPQVLVADVMGLLRPLYSLADVAFVGGSLVALGGHNPIEAAAAKLPVLMGPGRYNFEAVCAVFAEAGCLHLVADAAQIYERLEVLLGDDSARRTQGERAATLVGEHAGATGRVLSQLTRIASRATLQ